MSYVWLFPPLCDPYDGHLLGLCAKFPFIKRIEHEKIYSVISSTSFKVDGCYVNNVPGKVKNIQTSTPLFFYDLYFF